MLRFIAMTINGGNAVDCDNSLRPAIDAQFLQDSRDVRFNGRLGHAQFEGNLFVEQTLAEHGQNTNLLRR